MHIVTVTLLYSALSLLAANNKVILKHKGSSFIMCRCFWQKTAKTRNGKVGN